MAVRKNLPIGMGPKTETMIEELEDLFLRLTRSSTVRVLIEEQDKQERWTGFSDNYIKVATEQPLAQNKMAWLKITAVQDGIVLGAPAD